MDGRVVRNMVENTREHVRLNGRPVIVNGQGTVELINYAFGFTYSEFIDIDSIAFERRNYYKDNCLNLHRLEELEETEYKKIEDTLVGKFKLLDEDINSRRVLWADECCISFIQLIIRQGIINCFVNFRSSDVVYKLFSDLYLIHKICRGAQDYLNIKNVFIKISGSSFHEIVIADIKNTRSEFLNNYFRGDFDVQGGKH